MRTKAMRLLIFAASVAVLAGGLKLIGMVPPAIQADLMREYRDLDEMKAALNLPRVYVPSYFPQALRWPPARILAQGRPYPAVVLEFDQADTGRTVLVISQAASDDFLPGSPVEVVKTRERAAYPLKGRDSVLEVGFCRGGETCSRLSWKEEGIRVTVTARAGPLELIKVAESMLK